jgi:methylmalonyl-CoA/ethylmalonyl-CoA epimerase
MLLSTLKYNRMSLMRDGTMIEKVDHIGVIVKDLREVIKTMRLMGFEVESEELLKSKSKVAFLPIGETHIELIQPAEMKKDEVTGLDRSKEGIHHIAIRVDSINDTVKELKRNGVHPLPYYETPQPGARDTRIVFIDPKFTNQTLLELVEKSK